MIGISALNWIAAFMFSSFASVLLLGGTKKSTRTYAMVALCATGWVIGLGAYFFVDAPYWLVFWNRYNHVLAGLIAVAFFYFSLVVPEEKKPSRSVIITLFLIEVVFLVLYFFSDLIIADSHLQFVHAADRYQDLFFAVGPIFYLHFFGFFFLGFIVLMRKLRAAKVPTTKTQLSYLLWGTVIGVIPPILADIILPWLGIYDFYPFAGILTLGWIAFTSYAIARHQLFTVRLVLTSIAASAILSIAGILIVEISSDLGVGMLGRTAIFASFLAVGAFLIYSLRKGVERKTQLEKLRERLATLNEELTSRVRERTVHLKNEQEHSDQIIEHLTDGLVELDSQFRVIRINPAAERILGVDKDEVAGVLVSPQDVLIADREALARITFPGSASQDFAYSTKQGMRAAVTSVTVSKPYEREIEVATVTFGGISTGTGYVKVIRDITAQKELAESKSTFITTAAHKLRTPLSQTKWALGIFLEGDLGRLNKKQTALFEKVQKNNDTMIRLVNDLLNTAHLEEGRFGLNPAQMDLGALLSDLVGELTPIAKQHNNAIKLSIGDIPHIMADSDRLREALENVINNAIAYTPKGGMVSIEATADDANVTVVVRDTGIGIAKEDLTHIFDKFYRGSKAKQLREEGSGLGLFIVKSVIEGHGGSVDISSEHGKGTTVTLHIPTIAHAKG